MTQTAGLAVTYFDRFLSATGGSLAKNRVQIVALTCTLLAAKFSEIKMPSLDDLCEVAHGLFTKAQLKETELETLRVLHWELHAVTPHAALEQLAVLTNHTDDQSKTFIEHAEFFIDMSYYMVSSPFTFVIPPPRGPSAPPVPSHPHLLCHEPLPPVPLSAKRAWAAPSPCSRPPTLRPALIPPPPLPPLWFSLAPHASPARLIPTPARCRAV